MDYTEKLHNFLSPDLLQQKLITASVFIAVYENFKSAIVDNVKYFYCNGFENGKELFNGYEENVLSNVDSKKIDKSEQHCFGIKKMEQYLSRM